MDTFTIVVYLISNFVIMLAFERLMGVFFEKRKTPFVVLSFSYLLYFILSSIAFLLWGIPIINLSISLITVFIITLNYESSVKKRFVAMFSSFAIISVADIVLAIAFGFYQIGLTYSSYINDRVGFIILGSTCYILALLLRMFKNIRKSSVNPSAFLILYLLILLSSFVVLFIGVMQLPQVHMIIFIFVIFGINIFMYYIHDILSAAYEDKLKSALHAQEKEYYFTQCQLMQESVEQMKLYRHDVKFHLATLNDFAIKDNAENVIKYLNSLLGNIGKKEVYSDTGNIAFDSIINFKLKTAAEDNVKVDIDVFVPPNLNFEVADVVTILGNLLDNAIDGVSKVEDKIIKLNIEANKGNLFIKVDNTFDGEVKYAKGKDGIAEAITTRKSGDNHGYGLKNIRKAAEKYNGRVDISHEDNIFSVAVLLYVDEM